MNAYAYYTRQLADRLELRKIDFRKRLVNRLDQKPQQQVKILSLASGAARIEKQIITGLDKERIELTLLDINPKLVEEATENLNEYATVKSSVQNINELQLKENNYDIVMCVSALHHVVELEHLAQSIRSSLVEGGEFWSVGEYIGRNGTRLYDDAYEVANCFFADLPDKYRLNRNPGTFNQLDENLPNHDCSLATFEGIRSQDIMPVFNSIFDETESMAFDCFLWRLFNLAYLDNYDLNQEEDKATIDRAIDTEIEFFSTGGIPTAYWGVFQ